MPHRKICTSYWAKPIPVRQFDWTAWYDGDEPNDAGGMMMGYGKTREEAIADLKSYDEDEEKDN